MGPMEKAVRERKSVRTFDGEPLSGDERGFVEELIAESGNPFGVPVEFRALDAQEHGLKSPAVVGEHLYVAAKVARVADCEIAYGYEFERFCLEALAGGLGTAMLAASINREAFEKAMEVSESEVMPVASPIGHPAAKRSLREGAIRRALGADKRMPFAENFFEGSFGRPLDEASAGELARPLAAVRLAPSATNKQPWRVVADDGKAHFYELRSMPENGLGDIQKVDIGIALAHFDLVACELGMTTSFAKSDPGIEAPEGVEYIVTCETSR